MEKTVNYAFLIKKLKRYNKQLDELTEKKSNALSVGQEKEIFMQITHLEGKIEELKEWYDYFGFCPKSVNHSENTSEAFHVV